MPERRDEPVVPFGPRHRNGANGVRPDSLPARSLPLGEVDEPVDLVAVQADDELINALAVGMTVSAPGLLGYDTDDHVATILAAWKAEVDAEPVPELIDLDTAVTTIRGASPSPSRRVRHLAPVAAAAAFVVLTVAGVSVGSAAAEPDSVFWPVSRVLFSERAASIEAADRAEDHITRAKAALSEGQPEVAAQELQQAQGDLGQVRPQEGQAQLAEVQSFLVAKAVETSPGVKADVEAPLKHDPRRPVPTALTQAPDPSGPPIPAAGVATTAAPVTSVPPRSSTGNGTATSPPPSTAPPRATKEPLPPPPVTTQDGPDTTAPSSTTSSGLGPTTIPVPSVVVPS